MGILIMLSGTRPLAMPYQIKPAAIFAESRKYITAVQNISSINSLPETQMESVLHTAYFKLTDETKTTEGKLYSRQFYTSALKYCFQANDTDGIFYCMEQIKLLKLKPLSPGNEKLNPISIATLQRQLRSHHLQYLNYVQTDSDVYVMLVTPDKVDCRRIAFEGYDIVLKDFLEICADKELLNKYYKKYAQLSFLLYKKIVEPMHIAEGRILLAQEDPLLPFEALTTDSMGNDFLLYHYSICYTYSATWHFRAQPIHSAGNGFLGIAPEYYSPGAAQTRLHGAVESLQKIEDLFSIHNTLTLNAASKHNFLEAAGNCSVLHIYTHAQQENHRPVLYMHDKPLNMFDIGVLKSNSLQLVFLAACSTAVINDYKNSSPYSLADNFINAGASSVVGTLWLTETQPTYFISEAFYRLLEQGLSKDEALQQAKIQFIKKEVKPNQLPYYWAGVILLGDAEPLNPVGKTNASLYLAAIANLSLFAVGIFWKRSPLIFLQVKFPLCNLHFFSKVGGI